jgi:hypothetical protein
MSKEGTVPCLQWGQLRQTCQVTYIPLFHVLWGSLSALIMTLSTVLFINCDIQSNFYPTGAQGLFTHPVFMMTGILFLVSCDYID